MQLSLGLSIPQSAAVAPPLANFGMYFTGVLHSFQSDLGVTSSLGVVSAVADQSGGGAPVTGTCSVGAGVNGVPSLVFNGTTDALQFALDLPPPGTTPTFVWAVYRVLAAPAGNAPIVSGGSLLGCAVYCAAGSRNTSQFNGTVRNANAGSGAGAWGVAEVLFANSAADYVKFNATLAAAGLTSGNTDPAAVRYVGGGLGNNPLNFELLAMVHCNQDQTPGAKAAARAAVLTKYGF